MLAQKFQRIWFAEMIEYANYSPQNGNICFTFQATNATKQLANKTFSQSVSYNE